MTRNSFGDKNFEKTISRKTISRKMISRKMISRKMISRKMMSRITEPKDEPAPPLSAREREYF